MFLCVLLACSRWPRSPSLSPWSWTTSRRRSWRSWSSRRRLVSRPPTRDPEAHGYVSTSPTPSRRSHSSDSTRTQVTSRWFLNWPGSSSRTSTWTWPPSRCSCLQWFVQHCVTWLLNNCCQFAVTLVVRRPRTPQLCSSKFVFSQTYLTMTQKCFQRDDSLEAALSK